MNVHVARQTVMIVNRSAQCHRGITHRAGRRQRLRGSDHRALLYESHHPQQHEATGNPSQARVQAESHQRLNTAAEACEQVTLARELPVEMSTKYEMIIGFQKGKWTQCLRTFPEFGSRLQTLT